MSLIGGVRLLEFKIIHDQFERVKKGSKDIEIRLNDTKRKNIVVGDDIQLTDLDTDCRLIVIVKKLEIFASFFELFSKYTGLRVGSNENESIDELVSDMYSFYSVSDEKRFGVLAIFVNLIH